MTIRQNRASRAKSIVAFDVDGTLVDSDGQLNPGWDAVAALRSSDVKVGLCTARPVWGTESIATRLGGVDFIAGLQGTVVCLGEDVLLGPPISESLVASCIGSTSADDLWLYTDTDWFVSRISAAAELEASIIGRRWDGFVDQRSDPVMKMTLISSTHKLALRDLQIFQSKATYWEMISAGAEKEKGLRLLSERLGTATTVAFGDGTNDIAMLRFADRSFTFSDAPKDCRDVATDIIEVGVSGTRDLTIALSNLITLFKG